MVIQFGEFEVPADGAVLVRQRRHVGVFGSLAGEQFADLPTPGSAFAGNNLQQSVLRTEIGTAHQVPWKVSNSSSSSGFSPMAISYSPGVSIGFLNCGPSSVVMRGQPVLT